ncbi:MAG: hypothetical protein ACYDBJ_06210 [Aggregatilineales bacterium]
MNESELRKGLDEMSQQAIPATVNLWPSIQSRLSAQQHIYIVAVRLKMAGAVLTALIVVIALALAVRPRPVSAAEILSRAVQVTQNAAASGVQSYQGVINGFGSQDYAYRQPDGTTQFQTVNFQSQNYVWVQAPNHWRIENFTAESVAEPNSHSMTIPIPLDKSGALSTPDAPMPTDPQVSRLSMLNVSDGLHAWVLFPWSTDVTKYDSGDFEMSFLSTSSFFNYFQSPQADSVSDIQQVLGFFASTYEDVKLLDNTTIAGRDAYAVWVPFDRKTPLPQNAEAMVVWIDKETYLTLGYELLSFKGVIQGRLAFTSLSINMPIDPSVYSFTPPSQTNLLDLTFKPAVSFAELERAWAETKSQLNISLYAPTYLPPSVVADTPSRDTRPGWGNPKSVAQRFYLSDGTHLLTIYETNSNDTFVVGIGSIWNTTNQTDDTGYFTTPYEQRLVFYIHNTVGRATETTEVDINASFKVSKDGLYRIARSMRPISDSGQIIPQPTTTPATASP